MKKRRPENVHRTEKRLEDRLLRGAASLGWLLPETEEEVRATEENQQLEELPPRLRDPLAVLSGAPMLSDPRTTRQTVDEDATVVRELARAARDGKDDLPPEIEALMLRDRAKAEMKDEQ